MSKVAFLIYGIGDLKGGGGAERFFADLFDRYHEQPEKKHELYYIMDRASYSNLQKVNKLIHTKNVLFFKVISNRFKTTLEFLQIFRMIVSKRLRVIHIPLYDVSYLPLLKKIDRLASFFRPKIVINIVNCYVAQVMENKQHPQHASIKNSYLPLFSDLNADGYFCWNRSFEDYVRSEKVFKNEPKVIRSISSRFSDTTKFKPEAKENLVAFASRLDAQKH